MSYRQCIFAFPFPALDQTRVLSLAQDAARDLATQLDLPSIYARVSDPAWAERDGAWLLMLATTKVGDGVLNRGYFEDFWPPPFSVIVHDDQHGVFLFRHHDPDASFSLGSEGAALHGDVDRLPAPRDGQSAVALGIGLVYGRPLHYLDLLDTPTAWLLHDPGHHVAAPVEAPTPIDLRNYVDAWPGDDLTATTAAPSRHHAARQRLIDADPDAAVRILDRALALRPGDVTARYNRACAHARRGDRDRLLEDLAACLEAQPADADDAAADDDLAAYHHDPGFVALIARGRRRLGKPQLPAGLVAEIVAGEHEAFAVVPVPPDGVIFYRLAHYPHERACLDELLAIAPPTAITRDELEAYGARLAADLAERRWDLAMSVLAVGATARGVAGWTCGAGAVWRADDGQRITVSPYLEVPPGSGLPPTLLVSAISQTGALGGAWFEADGARFALVLAHPLPDLTDEPLRDLADVEGQVRVGVVGWWRRR